MTAADPLSATLFALADPTRRGILARLADGDASVKELAAPYAMSFAAVSKHIKVLENAGLVTRSKDAQWRPCHLEAEPLKQVSAWVGGYRRFWERSLDKVAELLDELQREDAVVGPAEPIPAPPPRTTTKPTTKPANRKGRR